MLNNLLVSGAFLMQALDPSTVAYAQTEPIPIPITIEQKIDQVADEYKISTTTLFNLLNSESSLDPNALGDMGITCRVGANKGLPVRARGLAAITDCYHSEISDEQAFNPDFAIVWAAKQIANDTAWKEFTVCNCYSYSRTQVSKLPAMKDIQPNTPHPVVGGLVIQYFGKVKHLSVISKVTELGLEVKETNLEPCKFTKRFIEFGNKNIEGYWRSPEIVE